MKSDSADRKIWYGMVLVALAAVVPRAYLAIAHMSAVGDGNVYKRVAQNILENGCISLSDPITARCVAHWGGNQLPGYPAFIAGVWALFSTSDTVVGVASGVVTALAILRAMYAIRALDQPPAAVLLVGLLLALSPAHVGWSSLILTEALAVAATIWVMAEIALCLAAERLRVLPLALSLVCAIFIRYDSLVLGIPVAALVLMLRPIGLSLSRALIVVGLVALPLGLWTARSLSLDLPLPINRYLVTEDLRPKPMGFTHWVRLWVHNQYEQMETIWIAFTRNYERIQVPDRAYGSRAERQRVEALLAELRNHDGRPIPRHIDSAFEQIASARVEADPLAARVGHPAARIGWLWLNPYTSLGWPAMADDAVGRLKSALATRDLAYIVETVGTEMASDPLPVIGKIVNVAYRYLLLVSVGVALFFTLRRGTGPVRRFAFVAALYAVVRTIAFGYYGYVESRFIVEAIPGLEIVLVLGLWACLGRPDLDRKPIRRLEGANRSLPPL